MLVEVVLKVHPSSRIGETNPTPWGHVKVALGDEDEQWDVHWHSCLQNAEEKRKENKRHLGRRCSRPWDCWHAWGGGQLGRSPKSAAECCTEGW